MIRLTAAILMVLGAWVTAVPESAAQQQVPPNATKAAVLDVERILRESAAMKSIRSQVIEIRKSFEQELRTKEEALRTENQELARKRTIMAPEAFAEERKRFEQKVAETRQLTQVRTRQLDQANTEAVRKVQQTYNEIVANLAAERGFGLIFRRSALVITAQQMEITADVLARLDTQLPAVTVVLPQ